MLVAFAPIMLVGLSVQAQENLTQGQFNSMMSNSTFFFTAGSDNSITIGTNNPNGTSQSGSTFLTFGTSSATWNLAYSFGNNSATLTATTPYLSPNLDWQISSPINSLSPLMGIVFGNSYQTLSNESVTISEIKINGVSITGTVFAGPGQTFQGFLIDYGSAITSLSYKLTLDTPNGTTYYGLDGIIPAIKSTIGGLANIPNSNWFTAIAAPTAQPIYPDCITKESGKDNLIIVTHGYIPPTETAAASTAWMDTMTNAICQYLTLNHMTNWQVAEYKWVTNAATGLNINKALVNAKMEGSHLGQCIVSGGWTTIHLISHSAGAGLIQACSEAIKLHSVSTVVQCTFLDPFLGFDYAGIAAYGKGSDWSDCYFSRDGLTGGEAHPFTQGSLTNAYNVDVTQLDIENRVSINGFASGSIGIDMPCYQTESTHSWPIDFYLKTIGPATLTGSDGVGFPLSQESGNTNSRSSYPPGNTPARILGNGDPVCTQGTYVSTPAYNQSIVNFSQSSHQQSDTGVIDFSNQVLRLTTDSPAWLATTISVTNPVNSVSFDASFESAAGAQGLLTIYWDTAVIGSVDEREVETGPHHYLLSFPPAMNPENHMLGFRIDPFTATHSTVMITNVTLEYNGVSQPFNLSVTTNSLAGFPVFQLTGQSGFTYTVQASTNLTDWVSVATLANTNGTVRFLDPDSTGFRQRFYRALAPY